MEKPTLLVLAAGMGSRYGSLKQMDGVDPNNEAIIKEIKRMADYRIHVDEDALSLIKSEYKQAPARPKKPLYANNKKNGKNNGKGPQRHNYSK